MNPPKDTLTVRNQWDMGKNKYVAEADPNLKLRGWSGQKKIMNPVTAQHSGVSPL